ncbi:MAG: CPBP family intramembrane metalloprotease [Boseongicola sp.]|nr:CPBP family intramembrane metalloprotease [Boseongicola sp.]
MIAAASQKPALWRLVAGVVTAVALLFAWLFGTAVALSFAEGVSVSRALRAVFDGDPSSPAGALKFLLIVSGLGFSTILAARLWQGRSAGSLIGPGARTLRHFAAAALITFGLAGLSMLVPSPVGAELERNMEVAVWLGWLPFTVFAVVAQSGAEEVFFRGYLQSQIAARFRNPMIWLLLPALLFGAAHYSSALPSKVALAYFAFAALFGLLAGDLTARTGSIGAAWGFHFANNMIAVAFIAVDGTITGLGLFRSSVGIDALADLSPWLLADLGALILVWWLIRRVLD